MEIQVRDSDRVRIISVVGSIDAMTADDFSSFVLDQLGEEHNQLVIDLSQLEFMSSAGLRAILAGLKAARRQGGDLRLAAAQPGVEKVLTISGFASILKAFPSVSEAVSSYS